MNWRPGGHIPRAVRRPARSYNWHGLPTRTYSTGVLRKTGENGGTARPVGVTACAPEAEGEDEGDPEETHVNAGDALIF